MRERLSEVEADNRDLRTELDAFDPSFFDGGCLTLLPLPCLALHSQHS